MKSVEGRDKKKLTWLTSSELRGTFMKYSLLKFFFLLILRGFRSPVKASYLNRATLLRQAQPFAFTVQDGCFEDIHCG